MEKKHCRLWLRELKIGKRIYHELQPDFTSEGVKIKRVRKPIQDLGKRKRTSLRKKLRKLRRYNEHDCRGMQHLMRIVVD